MGELQGIKAIITGGSSGIGQAISISYAQEGADIVFSYHRNKKGANETAAAIQSLGRKVQIIQANMSNIEDLQRLIAKGTEFLGGLDVFVNNAGTLTRHLDFLDIPIDKFDLIQKVNLKAPFILTQLAAKYMQRQNKGGSIINISSMSASIISPGLTHYECSKAALNMLTKAAANALAPYQIRVNAIAPGLVETAINQNQREQQRNVWDKRTSIIPLQRAGKPEDIAYVAKMLASPKSAWITGDIIPVDGGIGVRI